MADCRVEGLHFPFIVIIDFRGFRLIASTVLPINDSTLVYGSSDAATTIHTSEEEMIRRIIMVAKILNLAEHQVQNTPKTTISTLHTAVDVEGHKGTDGRYYIIDPARCKCFVQVIGLTNSVPALSSYWQKRKSIVHVNAP